MRHVKPAAFAAAVCLSASLSALAVSAQSAGYVGSIEINVADRGWIVQYWGSPDESTGIASRENASITGNGDYEASVTFENTLGSAKYLVLCADFGEDDMPEGMNVEITSVTVDGDNVDFGINGTPVWKEQDGRMCVNIFNKWTDSDSDIAAAADDFEGAENVTVRFSVSGLPEEEVRSAETSAPQTEMQEEAPAETEEEYIPPSDDIIGMEEPEDNTPNADTGDKTPEFAAAAAVSAALALIFRKRTKI